LALLSEPYRHFICSVFITECCLLKCGWQFLVIYQLQAGVSKVIRMYGLQSTAAAVL